MEPALNTVIEAFGSNRFKETLKAFLNSQVQEWQAIHDLCQSFATEIVVTRLDSIEANDGMISADFTVSFIDMQMAVCCEVQPGDAKTVSAKVSIDRTARESQLKLGVFWDTDNDGY